jgi:putative redox protein
MTNTTATKPVITKSRATWRGEHRFDAGPDGRTAPIDGDSKMAPGPVETLLSALATCSGVDILDILAKRRTPAERFEIEVTATRRSESPRRVEHLEILFAIDGAKIAVADAERAIQLSFEKYCSVAASLAPDIEAHTTLVLNGRREHPQKRAIWRSN